MGATQCRRAWRAAATLAAVGLAASPTATGAAASAISVVSSASSPGRYGFNKPIAIAYNGGHLWIANYGGNSVTEMTAGGTWVRTVSGRKYGFRGPDAIVSYLGDVFVVNRAGSVTELNATSGSLVRIIGGAKYDFGSPVAAVERGGNIWVVDATSRAVTEFSAATGALIRTLTNKEDARYAFNAPDAIAVAGADIWVTNKTGGSRTDPHAGAATEFMASTGAFVRRVATSNDGLERPSGIAFDGTHLWITDAATSSVTELSSTGALVRIVSNSSFNDNYGFNAPTVVVASSPNVYVVSPPGASPMVTQINAATAEGNWYECNTNTPDPQFNNPTGLIVHGGYVWVVSPGDNTLTQLSLAAGGNRVHLYV